MYNKRDEMAESMPDVRLSVEIMCHPCCMTDNKCIADVFCTICDEFQCNDCSYSHTADVLMKDHKLLSVNERQIQLASMRTDHVNMNGIDMCTKHNKRFKFYCDDDKALACSMCAIIDHRKCNSVVELENIIKDEQCEKHQCNTLREKLQTAITTMNQAVENLKEAESCLSDDVKSVPDKLSKMRNNIIQKFDEFAEEVTKVANSYRDKTTGDWAQRTLEYETKIKTMKCSMKTMDNIVSKGTPLQQFITAHSMTETVDTEVKKAAVFSTDMGTLNVSCIFSEHVDTLKSGLLSAMTSDVFDMEYNKPKKTKLELIASIDIKQTGDEEEEPLYTGLDFLSDGRLVVVDNQNHKSLVFDENLTMKTSYKLPYEFPLSVVAVSDEEVAITSGDEYSLVFLHVSNSNEITLNRICKVKIEYESICMKDDENFVVGTIDHDTPVRIVSMSGEEKDFDIVFPSKKYPVGTSSCTYIRGQDKIVLTDGDEDTVYVYDVMTGERVVIKDELIEVPCGVAVGPYDHIFTGSDSSSSLVEITPGGRVLSSHHVDMKYPCYLAVSKDRRKLAISNSATGSIKLNVYQILSE